MRKNRSLLPIALSLLLLIVSPSAAVAWGNTGHEAVAYVAWGQLTPATKKRVVALLKKVPTVQSKTTTIPGYTEWVKDLPAGLKVEQRNRALFMRAATWADSIKHSGLYDTNQPPRKPEVHLGFNDKSSHGYWHFIDLAFTVDGTAAAATPAPNAVTQIVAMRRFLASTESDLLKAYDLVWIEHLVGDVHMPLHASARYTDGKSDAGGNLVKVKLSTAMGRALKCPPSESVPRELHAFWDDLPGACPAIAGAVRAQAFAKDLPLLLGDTGGPEAVKVADTEPNDWAVESLALAKKDVYVAPIGKKTQPEDGSKSFVLTQAYFDQAMTDAKTQIALAGARLAKLLNENLK